MDMDWPQAVVDFEAFLLENGFACKCRESGLPFGDRVLEYRRDILGVRLVRDKGSLFVELADLSRRSHEWFDVPILRTLLIGSDKGALDVLPLGKQLNFVKANLAAIADLFGDKKREGTHPRLMFLRHERAKRIFPELFRDNESP